MSEATDVGNFPTLTRRTPQGAMDNTSTTELVASLARYHGSLQALDATVSRLIACGDVEFSREMSTPGAAPSSIFN